MQNPESLPLRRLLIKALVVPVLAAALLFSSKAQFRSDGMVLQNAPVRFAVIGDYGVDNQDQARVASLVKRLNPDFIITVGDNNYPDGEASTIDENVGKYYHQFIHPYRGKYGKGADVNRFFPTLGNHDWHTPNASPYLSYFTLPNNERYYDFVRGPVHLFALDSDTREPDGTSDDSRQGRWLQSRLAASTSPWKVVYFHHAPYSSGRHGGSSRMRWPFKEWGASVVLTGHDHLYERLMVDGLPYFVNGVGGAELSEIHDREQGSIFRYDDGYGAQLVTAGNDALTLEFFDVNERLIDSYSIVRTVGGIRLTATAQGSGRINLTWTDPTNEEDRFVIERSSDNRIFMAIAAVGQNGTTYSDTRLQPQGTYYYRVRWQNTRVISPYSNVASVRMGSTPDKSSELLPIADVTVAPGAFANSNYGNARELKVRTNTSQVYQRDTYFLFDLGGAGPISTAKLRFQASLSANTTVPVALYAVSNTTWRENAVTWNTRPSTAARIVQQELTGSTSRTYELDVTDYVKRELAAGRSMISFAMKQPVSTKIMVWVNSKEAASHQPRLLLGSVASSGQ